MATEARDTGLRLRKGHSDSNICMDEYHICGFVRVKRTISPAIIILKNVRLGYVSWVGFAFFFIAICCLVRFQFRSTTKLNLVSH